MTRTWDDLYSQLYENASKKRQIISATFELISRCNLQCKMCYVCEQTNDNEIRSRELSAAQWIDLGRQARDEGLLYLTLTGGEVFLRTDFREIYESLVELGIVVQIYTNGTMITPEIVQWLKKMPPKMVSITLYGADSETYELVTGHADGYERAVRAVDLLIENGIPVEVKTTVIEANKKQYLQISEFARKRGIRIGIVNYVSPRREGSNSDPLGNRLSPSELAEYEEFVVQRNRQLIKENKTNSVLFADSGEDGNKPEKEVKFAGSVYDKAFQCGTGKCSIWISWDGRLIPCGIMGEPSTYPLKTGLHNAWEDIKQICDTIPMCNDCVSCDVIKYCDKCPARLKNESGDWDKKGSYLCDTANARFKQVQKRV